ncbi:MarR family winged helix-turn-helix transcriptional regulator [Arthrobacter castelli]|uniref:MarR family winged helix-turn-helix transcriptional regulator n=1 Tax=Arthrobacter castelli TaxID=271431 RepID=UPI00040BDAE8|nr:MarR family transcriptional regulator [Arthrobacter castelli]
MSHTTDVEVGGEARAQRMAAGAAGISLEVALVRLSHLVQRVFAEVSRDHDLTPQQTQLLCRLVDGPVGMADLGRMLDLEKSGLSGLVDRVESRGLVARTRSDRDRRAYQVALTTAGLQVGTTAHDGVISRLGEYVGDTAQDDRQHLTTLITRMLDN